MSPPPGTVTCPRCGHSQGGGAECQRCGVIFAKARKRAEEPPPEPAPPATLTDFARTPAHDPDAGSTRMGKVLGLVLVLALAGGGAWGYVKWEERRQAKAEQAEQETGNFDDRMYQLAVQMTGSPEKIAADHAVGHDELQQALGKPLEAQPEGASNVTSNGKSGNASLRLRVSGSSGKSTSARVQLVRENGRWRVTSLTYDPPP